MLIKLTCLVVVPLTIELFQEPKIEEKKQLLIDALACRIESALRWTTITVKFSSNLTRFTPWSVITDISDNSVLIPIGTALSNQWSFFLLSRTTSHSPLKDQYLVSTYKKYSKNKHWKQILKKAAISHQVYFEDINRLYVFNTLKLSHYNFVLNNIQARNERSGNCLVLAETLHYFLWNKAIKSADNLIHRIEVVTFKALDHCFVIINRALDSVLSDHMTWNGWIIDPWRGVKGSVSVLHTNDFVFYDTHLREFRPDIIFSHVPQSLEIEEISSTTDILEPANRMLFKTLEDLIYHGKMNLIAEKTTYRDKDISTHKSRFFAVKTTIETLAAKKDTTDEVLEVEKQGLVSDVLPVILKGNP